MGKGRQLDPAVLKQQASGLWLKILTSLGGISAELLNGKHHPCPRCGGTDRFRAIDLDNGALYCNQCFSTKNGDGIAALMWLTGRPFKEVAAMLCEYLGVKPTHKAGGKSKRPKIFGTPRGAVCYFVNALAKQHGAGVKFIQSWSYDTFTVLRFDLPTPDGEKQRKEFRPVHQVPLGLDGGRGWQAGYPAGPRPLYRRQGMEGGSVDLVTIHGGEKAVDVATALGLVATTSAGGEKAMDHADWSPILRFSTIALVVDNDPAGEAFGQIMAAKIWRLKSGADVRIVKLPNLPPKGDVVEWIAAGGTKEEFLRIVEETEPVTAEQIKEWMVTSKKTSPRSQPDIEIIIGTDESRVIDEAIDALATRQNIYQRGGNLVHIVEGTEPPRGIARPKESPRIAPMRFARIRELLADAAVWLRPAGDDDVEQIHPPDWVVKAIDARGQWSGIRRLEAVVESPILRADGTILQDEGYDLHTGIVFRSQVAFPRIGNRPTKDEAVLAAKMLLEVVEDFPFGNDAHRAAWLASVLTPLARYAYHGTSPLYLFDANVRGCGKSLLTDATSIIIAGRPMARMSLPHDDDETRKRITALAVAGEPLILIDNLPAGGFGSPSLDAALTATSWSDRILGQTAMASAVPLYATWYATGNNVILVGDTARRVVHIRLESSEENPEARADFHHSDLLAWVHQERPRLTVAAVTILAAYCAAGRPDMQLSAWGSFEAWSDLVRQAVVWSELPDPGSTRTELTSQADREAVALRQLIAGWEEVNPSGCGMTVGEALRELVEHPTEYDALRAALFELAPPRNGTTLNPRSVGMKLHHLRRRVVTGKCFDRRDTNQGAVWMVRSSGDSRGSSDTSIDSACTGTCAHARENLETPDSSVTTTPSVTKHDSVNCFHDWVDTRNGDGRIKRS